MQVLPVQSLGGKIKEEVIEASMFKMDSASDDGLVRAYTHLGSIGQGPNTGKQKAPGRFDQTLVASTNQLEELRLRRRSAEADLSQDALAGQQLGAEADHEAEHGQATVPGLSEVDEAKAGVGVSHRLCELM